MNTQAICQSSSARVPREREVEGATDGVHGERHHTQTPLLRYVSSARARRAFVHDIVRYMAATISYA